MRKVEEVAKLVAEEVERAGAEFGEGFASDHEALGVLLEEFREVEAWVFRKPAERDAAAMLRELVQVSATASRWAAGKLGELEEALVASEAEAAPKEPEGRCWMPVRARRLGGPSDGWLAWWAEDFLGFDGVVVRESSLRVAGEPLGRVGDRWDEAHLRVEPLPATRPNQARFKVRGLHGDESFDVAGDPLVELEPPRGWPKPVEVNAWLRVDVSARGEDVATVSFRGFSVTGTSVERAATVRVGLLSFYAEKDDRALLAVRLEVPRDPISIARQIAVATERGIERFRVDRSLVIEKDVEDAPKPEEVARD